MNVKLTDEHIQTYQRTQWVVGEWRETDGAGELCGPGWLHYYRSPLLAVLHNPIHANLTAPRLWRVEVGPIKKHDGWMKSGSTRLRLVEELPLPQITVEQRVRYAIYCVMKVTTDPGWLGWAERWLVGDDRSYEAARVAEWAAAWAAEEAACAAGASACAAWARACVAREWAAWAKAAWAAACAAERGPALRLDRLAKKAIRDEEVL